MVKHGNIYANPFISVTSRLPLKRNSVVRIWRNISGEWKSSARWRKSVNVSASGNGNGAIGNVIASGTVSVIVSGTVIGIVTAVDRVPASAAATMVDVAGTDKLTHITLHSRIFHFSFLSLGHSEGGLGDTGSKYLPLIRNGFVRFLHLMLLNDRTG